MYESRLVSLLPVSTREVGRVRSETLGVVAGLVELDFEEVGIVADEQRRRACAHDELPRACAGHAVWSVEMTSAFLPRAMPEASQPSAMRRPAVPP